MVANYLRMMRGAVLLLCLPLAKSTTSSFSLPSLPSFSLPFFGNGGLVREKPIPLPSSPVSRDLEIGVPLGLGTWAWGNQLLWGYDPENDAELQAAFNAAVDAGVTFFDTGDSYGTGKLEGRAEELLGRFRAEYPGPPEKAARLVFGTKLATYPWRVTADSMESALLASLERLGGGRVEARRPVRQDVEPARPVRFEFAKARGEAARPAEGAQRGLDSREPLRQRRRKPDGQHNAACARSSCVLTLTGGRRAQFFLD